jgi:DNA-binding response OmpR family regulator
VVHIFIVDDEESVADLIGQMLEANGYLVTVKHESVDALKTFQENPEKYDLVITNQIMTSNELGGALALKLKEIKP